MKTTCTRCGKALTDENTVMLLKHRNGKYYFPLRSAHVPDSDVVSRHAFGKDCALKVGHVFREKTAS